MKSLKYILLIFLFAFIGFSIYVAVQPNSFKVTRTKIINAPQTVVYKNVIDFKNWKTWSSWIEEQPETVITLSNQTEGIGGSYTWEDANGLGILTTTATELNKTIEQDLQFDEFPISSVNWNFKPIEAGKTEVTWRIEGKKLPFIFKAFTIIKGGIEKQIGPHFERSLVKLDSVLQAEMKVYSITTEGVTQHSGGFYLYNTTSCKLSEFETNMKVMLPKVGAYALSHNITMAGKPFILYHKWDEANDAVIFSCCIPTTSKITTSESDILTGQLHPFKTVKTLLKGDYKNLKEAWNKTMAYIAENNLEVKAVGPMLETYITNPISTPNPANWLTEIYVAVN